MTTPALSGFHIALIGSLRGYGRYSSSTRFEEGVRQRGGILLDRNHPHVNLLAVKELLGEGGRTKLVSNLINRNPGMLFVDSHDLALFLGNVTDFPLMFTFANGKFQVSRTHSPLQQDASTIQTGPLISASLSDLVIGYPSTLGGICI